MTCPHCGGFVRETEDEWGYRYLKCLNCGRDPSAPETKRPTEGERRHSLKVDSPLYPSPLMGNQADAFTWKAGVVHKPRKVPPAKTRDPLAVSREMKVLYEATYAPGVAATRRQVKGQRARW